MRPDIRLRVRRLAPSAVPRRRVLALALLTLAAATPATIAPASSEPRLHYDVVGVSAQRVVEGTLRDRAQEALVARAVRLHARSAELRGRDARRGALRDELAGATIPRLEARISRLRDRIRTLERTGGAPDVAIPGPLAAIAACESGGNPGAVSSGGHYRGKYQFDHATWASVGGSGDPAAAPEVEQDRRAAMLYARAGATPWPTCGR